MSRRKKYSKEFKLDAVSLVTDQGYSRAEAARSLGLNSNMLGRWVSEHQTDGGQSSQVVHAQRMNWPTILRMKSTKSVLYTKVLTQLRSIMIGEGLSGFSVSRAWS